MMWSVPHMQYRIRFLKWMQLMILSIRGYTICMLGINFPKGIVHTSIMAALMAVISYGIMH